MKAKLIKQGNEYFLRSLIKDIPSSINVYHKISETEGEFGFGKHSGKLSKQNCDEIFGVVDVEKLAKQFMIDESYGKQSTDLWKGYLFGFNKAMELYKPTEIEVEIIMDRIPADLAPGGWDVFPKLDESGCLILKKVL
jgi:hypothetical protein